MYRLHVGSRIIHHAASGNVMTRQVRLAFDFEVESHSVAELLRMYLKGYNVEVGYGEHVNGIPLDTVIVTRKETE